ncbi:vomeronasal type-2 receptor 116-like [Dendropsophus ebraccatus]|uniref:vomeronasal type-2 receptor 116-like n=1 Tax=Dendropsophus ebraccatus TaxID=150705 RepID=UPI003831CE58
MDTTRSETILLFDVLKLLKSLAVILIIFLTVSLCSKNDLGCKLLNYDKESPTGYSRNGDVIIAGLQVYDSCTSENLAVKSVLNIISKNPEPIPNYVCNCQRSQKNTKTIAIVGHLLSSSTYTIAKLSHLYGYPQISYGASNSIFSDREMFPLLHRTVPSQLSQFHAIIRLLVHFGWTWVGIITTDDDSNQLASVGLKKEMAKHGICVDFLTFISIDPEVHDSSALKVMQTIKNSSANVIILYLIEIILVGFLESGLFGVTGKVWITTVGMDSIIDKTFSTFINKFNGSLIITVQTGEMTGFQNFLLQATYANMPSNVFLIRFWQFSLGCMDVQDKLSIEQSCADDTLWKNLLNYYLKHVRLKTISGGEVFINNEGFVEGNFDILNFVADSNSKITKPIVGSWSSSCNQVQMNNNAIIWNPSFNKTPQSFCSYPCSPGYRKALMTGKLECCFDCVQCNDGEVTSGTAMESCQKCPEDQWSNPARDKCIKRPLHFLSYEEELGMSLAVIASIFFGITTSVLWVFVKNRNTPLVRANNRNLSYVLLVSLMICFLLSFLFIGHPEELTCLLRQTSFFSIFAVAISSVLGKTTTVLIAFNATKPGSRFKKIAGSRIPHGLVILCSLGEFLICISWLIWAPPFVELDTKTISGTIIVQCNEGSIVAFYVAISYVWVLAVSSFIIAYISRRLPDTFNEAQYITFSMLVFCSVWMSFIPTYICTKGKYMVAVEIFAILASNGALLFFVFFPKCYIILLRPDHNTKSNIKVKVFQLYK